MNDFVSNPPEYSIPVKVQVTAGDGFACRFLRSVILLALGFGFATLSLATPVQDSPFEKTETAAPENQIPQPTTPGAPSTGSEMEMELPPPENIVLDTSDGVNLHCTYFAAAKGAKDKEAGSGKTAYSFILLHDWDGNRTDLLPFAKYLQSLGGCAVIVPDLRGHGETTTATGLKKPLDYKTFNKAEVVSTMKDVERCKKYLIQKNNSGELNIDMLNLVAVGKTAALALDWTIADWYAFPSVQAGIKQGQDVKSITLISPQMKLEGMSVNVALKHPLFAGTNGPNLPTLIVWPADRADDAKESSSIYETMKKGRPDVAKIEDVTERDKRTTLYNAVLPRSSATATELIRDQPVEGLWPYIAKFVATQVGAKRDDFRWQSRERE